MQDKKRARQVSGKPRGFWKKHRKLEKFAYLLPSITIFCVFMVWPIVYNMYLSTMEYGVAC